MMKGLRRALERDPAAAARALALLDSETPRSEDRARRQLLRALVGVYGGGDRYYLNFYGPPGSIRTISFHTLLQEDGNVPDLTNAIVFVGEGTPQRVSGTEQGDVFRTVYSGDGGRDLSGAAAGSLFRLLPGRLAIAAAIVIAGAYWAVAQHQFTTASRLLPLAILLGVQLAFALFMTVRLRYRALRRHVPRELKAGARPELVQGVCLSTDIEKLQRHIAGMEPRSLASLMNEYYDTLGALVTRHGGLTLVRTGDSAMCIWSHRTRPWPFRPAAAGLALAKPTQGSGPTTKGLPGCARDSEGP